MGRILITLICVLIASCAAGREDAASALLREHNVTRAQRGLQIFSLDEDLCSYAQKHAEKMAKENRLAHSSMRTLASAADSGLVAENIAWGQTSEAEVFRSWMNSSGHRANILGKNYKRVGFGVKEDKNGRKYWCAVFSE